MDNLDLEQLLQGKDPQAVLAEMDQLTQQASQIRQKAKKQLLMDKLDELGIDSVDKLNELLSNASSESAPEQPEDERLTLLNNAGIMNAEAIRGVLYPTSTQIKSEQPAVIINRDKLIANRQMTSGKIGYVAYPLQQGNWLLVTAGDQDKLASLFKDKKQGEEKVAKITTTSKTDAKESKTNDLSDDIVNQVLHSQPSPQTPPSPSVKDRGVQKESAGESHRAVDMTDLGALAHSMAANYEAE